MIAPLIATVRAPMLAIVSPTFNQVSETFVADHVRTLAPGRTVLVCQDGAGAAGFGCPVLARLATDPDPVTGLAALRLRLRRRAGYGPVLGRPDRTRLAEFLRAQGVTVVLAEFGYSGALVWEVCGKLGLPLFVYFRGHDATRHRVLPSLARRYRRMFAHVAGVICVSRYLADQLVAIGCPERLIAVNPSGVDPAAFPPARAEPGRLLAVGRLVEMKAPHLTLRAFGRIAADFPQARLDLVGDGPLRPRCEAVIAELGLASRVTLHGARDHAAVAALMGRAAVFVQHSVSTPDGFVEGFPTAIAEAMSSALPVVATRHSGIPEHVRDEVTGLLVAEGDVEGMAAALAALLADPERARSFGAAGRAHALARLDRDRSRAAVRALLGLPAPAAGPRMAAAADTARRA